MRILEYVEHLQDRTLRLINVPRVHPIVLLKRTKELMASIVVWLIGLLFLGIGSWILLLRFEGLIDLIRPHNMLIGQMTIDGKESKGHAELLRARFDHHFRHPVAIPRETGFLEVLTLDTPGLFRQKSIEGPLKKMTVEVSGVDVGYLLQLVNQLAKPDQWVVEGDFQIKSDRALLALRMRRGQRLIRTWYLERSGNTDEDKSMLLERLIDDAIFQLAYDFGNKAEQDEDLQKWRRVLPAPTSFPSRTAVAAYYEGRGALGRYYAQGDWRDLDLALGHLRALRGQMPEYADGLQLLGMALAEKRNEAEAIHVYEQLQLLLVPAGVDRDQLSSHQKLRLSSIELLKATATAKLYTWRSTHEALSELLLLDGNLIKELAKTCPKKENEANIKDCAANLELHAQAAIQLAYTYALYLSYIRHVTVADIFGDSDAPESVRIFDTAKLKTLRVGPPEAAKQIVRQVMKKVAGEHRRWIDVALEKQAELEQQWNKLADGKRRKAELISRLNLALGYAHYRMAELENSDTSKGELVFGQAYEKLLGKAAMELRKAEAAHPNHYQVLQFLGLVYSEPRRKDGNLSIAEQYFERAILANPSDYYGHALLAGILLRRVANMGLGMASRATIERGLAEVEAAVLRREISANTQLLRAHFLIMLLEIERDKIKRRDLRVNLEQSINQAARFLPHAFGRPDVDLTWVRIVADTRRLGKEPEAITPPQNRTVDLKQQKQSRFLKSKQKLMKLTDELIKDCSTLEKRWVAHQRIVHIKKLGQRVRKLREEIENATLENWREIQVEFL